MTDTLPALNGNRLSIGQRIFKESGDIIITNPLYRIKLTDPKERIRIMRENALSSMKTPESHPSYKLPQTTSIIEGRLTNQNLPISDMMTKSLQLKMSEGLVQDPQLLSLLRDKKEEDRQSRLATNIFSCIFLLTTASFNPLDPGFQYQQKRSEKEHLSLNKNKSEYFHKYNDQEKNRIPFEEYKLPEEWYHQIPKPPVVQRNHKKIVDPTNEMM